MQMKGRRYGREGEEPSSQDAVESTVLSSFHVNVLT